MLETASSEAKRKKYFAIERLLMKIAGVSLTDNETRAYKIYSWVTLLLFNYTYPIVASLDLFKQKFNDSVDNWFYVAATFMANAIISTTIRNRLKLGRLLDKLEEDPFLANKRRGGDEEEKLLQTWLSFSSKQTTIFAAGVIVSVVTQMIYTLIIRVRSSDYRDWNKGFAQISVLNTTYSPNYEISMLYQYLSILYICFNTCSTTLIIAGVLAHISTQFKILQNNIVRIIRSNQRKSSQKLMPTYSLLQQQTNKDFSNISWKNIQVRVRQAVSYHLDILGIVKEMEEIFSAAILSVYIGTLAMLCLEVYRASLLPAYDLRTLRLLIETISASFHSGMICYSGEQMAHESREVANAAFESNFIGTDLRFQKSIIMIIRKSQNPIKIKAGKLIDTSLVTFAWILRTSYSAYMVLRNTNMQENKSDVFN